MQQQPQTRQNEAAAPLLALLATAALIAIVLLGPA